MGEHTFLLSMKVLIIGSGGREHALVKAALKSDFITEVIAAPGNGGISCDVSCFNVKVDDVPGLVKLAEEEKAEFVIVGPELPLTLGLVDALEAVGIPAFGPHKKGAVLEGSKEYTKNFFKKYEIPTALGETFRDFDSAVVYLKGKTYPQVIKASGLAAGKGVIIVQNEEEGRGVLQEMMVDRKFGESGARVVIEDFLEGPEASIMVVVNGENYALLAPSQDHKKIFPGEKGPNTGGMGAYAPAPVVTQELLGEIEASIVRPSLKGLVQEGIDYRGILYIGLILAKEGPKVLEYNVRLGDPECQVLLPILDTDPIKLFYDCANGTMGSQKLPMKAGAAITVVLVSQGYPGDYEKNKKITLPETLPEGVEIIHSGTVLFKDDLYTAGGRVLCVTALGPTLARAANLAYDVCDRIEFEGAYYRQDIGHQALMS